MTSQCYLKFKSFNVEGLVNKIRDHDFLDNIKQYDFITLSETWVSGKISVDTERYYCFNKSRKKAKKAKLYSGSISVLVKKSLRKGIKSFSSKSSRFVWWKLDKHFFNLDEDTFVCSVYIHPTNSKYFGQSEIDPYDKLESDLIHYGKLMKLMLMGDFNSRKGQLDDTPEFNLGPVPFIDSFVEVSAFQDVTIHPSSKKLHSMDQTTNRYGCSLTNICISHNLRFFNGRMQDDMLGLFTCHKCNGASTIDYVIFSQSLLEDVVNFSVLPLSFFSSHCPIAFTLKTKVFKIDKNAFHFLLSKHRAFIWNNEKINQFSLFLNMESSVSKVDLAIEQMSQSQFSNNSIDTVVTSINEVVNDAARKCFATKNCKKNKNHHRNSRRKRWLDKDSEEAKKELLLSTKKSSKISKRSYCQGKIP